MRILLLLSLLLLLYSMGRYGRVVSASSCAYRCAVLGAGPCDVYRTVFCPTLRSLSVRTYSARVSASFPTSCYTGLRIYTNSRISCRCTLQWFVLTGTFLTSRYCRCRLPKGSSWGSGAGCVRVDHTCGTWWEGTL